MCTEALLFLTAPNIPKYPWEWDGAWPLRASYGGRPHQRGSPWMLPGPPRNLHPDPNLGALFLTPHPAEEPLLPERVGQGGFRIPRMGKGRRGHTHVYIYEPDLERTEG